MKPFDPRTDVMLKGKLAFTCSQCQKKVEMPMEFRSPVDAHTSLLTYKDKREVHDCKKGEAGLLTLSGVSFEIQKTDEKKGAE